MPSLAALLRASPWARALSPADLAPRRGRDRSRAICPPGSLVCRKGEAVEAWIGVIDGLVKMANVSPDGKPTSFVGVGPGGWFGEGSLLKDEPRRYDIVALRESEIAYMPRATFTWLLDTSMAFNRFLLTQLNERLGQFIGMVEHDRLLGPDARLARCLAGMFNPHPVSRQQAAPAGLAGGDRAARRAVAPAREPGAAAARAGRACCGSTTAASP